MGPFWNDDANAINSFVELTQPMRQDDAWYSAFLNQCRAGNLKQEMYHFCNGLPTEHCGSWIDKRNMTNNKIEGFAQCKKINLQELT